MNPPLNPDVIIVGAGTAGLAAAAALKQAGLTPLVLEAASHSGGRAVTDITTFSQPFDRGGSWLHSATINPLARLAAANGTELYKAEWSPRFVTTKGQRHDPSDVAAYAQYLKDMWQAINSRQANVPDVSTYAAMPGSHHRTLAQWHVPQMLGGDADATSARGSAAYRQADGDWLVAGGLGGLIQTLHRHIDVVLNCSVTRISHGGPEVVVETTRGTARAPHLILTISTGVLASGAIRFEPGLPEAKQAAIANLPNGLLNKIGIEFLPAFQEAGTGQMLDYHEGGNAFCSILFGFYGTPLATGFVAGSFADELEQAGAGAATAFCKKALVATFGGDILKTIRKCDETAWRAEPLSRGAYSYARPGHHGARETLAAPLGDRLFFAGEATMSDAFATVHGAFQSGQRAAAQILAHNR